MNPVASLLSGILRAVCFFTSKVFYVSAAKNVSYQILKMSEDENEKRTKPCPWSAVTTIKVILSPISLR